MTALVFATVALASYPAGAGAVTAGLIAAVLVVVAGTDIERRVIPNRIVLPATAAVLVLRVVFLPDRAVEFILAALVAGLIFMIPNLINPSAMGMGDVKLVAFLGAGLGRGVIGAVVIGSFAMLPFALAALVRGGPAARKQTLPFGPFLAFGALAVVILSRILGG